MFKVKSSKIKKIKAREILDSRGNPTVEVELETDLGKFLASVPSGASKGKYEAMELRDKDGRGVLKAVNNVNKIIAPKLIRKDPRKQKEIDNLMVRLDGTKNKSRLGANAILGVSMAVCRAGVAAKNLPFYSYISQIYGGPSSVKLTEVGSPLTLPIPSILMIEGGAHAGNELDFQEFMIVPQEKSFSENLRIGTEIYHQLKEILAKKFGNQAINLGDEGGFAPPVRVPEEALELILKAAKNLGYHPHTNFGVGVDIAASQFYSPPTKSLVGGKKGNYQMKIGTFTKEGLLNYYLALIQKYPIIGLEDPFAEEDWEGWQLLGSRFKVQGSRFLIIGDDLTVTNPERIKMAYKKKACNAIVLKPNQIGTVSETIEAAKIAKSYGWKIIVSHRSGETCDDFISDLAVGVEADFIKAGAPARGERVAKYNRLLRIEEEIKK